MLANLKLIPGGGEARGLTDGLLVIGLVVNFLLGALMTLGIGLYAPVPDPGEPARHEPGDGIPDHDGLLRVPDAARGPDVHEGPAA